MCENYRRLLADGREIFQQLRLIGPGIRMDRANHCPAVADRISDYLRDGRAANSVIDGGHEFRIPDSVSWRRLGINAIGRGLRDCNHVVVRATRSEEQQQPTEDGQPGRTEHHYFVLFRLDGTLYVADPFFHPTPSGDIQRYNRGLVYESLHVASNYDVAIVNMFDPTLI